MNTPLLFVVEHAFQIEGRGCILVPGPSTEPGNPNVRVGTRIKLVLPAGAEHRTSVRGVEMINFRSKPKTITAPILLPPDLTKADVPPGTRVFLDQDE